MLFYFNLYQYQTDELFKSVSCKKDFLRLKLKLLEYIHLWTGNKEIVPPYCCIDFDNLKRAFLVNQDGSKIISFSFPFIIKTQTPNYNSNNSIVSVHYSGKSGTILPRNISEAYSILLNYSTREDNLYTELVLDDEDNIAYDSFRLFEYLLFCEDGYIRYDYDFKNQNAITHPLNHFDIHYSEPSHYKIGLPNRLELNTFLTILDKKKTCYHLNPNPNTNKLGMAFTKKCLRRSRRKK